MRSNPQLGRWAIHYRCNSIICCPYLYPTTCMDHNNIFFIHDYFLNNAYLTQTDGVLHARAKLGTKLAQATYFVVALCPTAVLRSYFVVFYGVLARVHFLFLCMHLWSRYPWHACMHPEFLKGILLKNVFTLLRLNRALQHLSKRLFDLNSFNNTASILK